ncbi:uncharacterized protein VTP21DRAFT_10506 [Calcarisporiella thermophila]|uniref:uncharacterized protein n=1 Tax=Calcarisporiella thermophila TaxID=911321 RepID=UPI003742110E
MSPNIFLNGPFSCLVPCVCSRKKKNQDLECFDSEKHGRPMINRCVIKISKYIKIESFLPQINFVIK